MLSRDLAANTPLFFPQPLLSCGGTYWVSHHSHPSPPSMTNSKGNLCSVALQRILLVVFTTIANSEEAVPATPQTSSLLRNVRTWGWSPKTHRQCLPLPSRSPGFWAQPGAASSAQGTNAMLGAGTQGMGLFLQGIGWPNPLLFPGPVFFLPLLVPNQAGPGYVAT